MGHCEDFVVKTGSTDPKEALSFAYASATKEGTCTACIATAVGDGSVQCCNLGDSGIALLRRDEPHSLTNADALLGQERIPRQLSEGGRPMGKWKVVFATVEQTHYFNCPYQLGTSSRDRPKDAQMVTIPVTVGDILITGTDGFFDNMFPSDTLRIVENFEAEAKDPSADLCVEGLAEALALESFRLANAETGVVPFGGTPCVWSFGTPCVCSFGTLVDVDVRDVRDVRREVEGGGRWVEKAGGGCRRAGVMMG